RRVTAGDGEGEGEVGGGVDRDDAQRHLVAAQVRHGGRGGLVGVVDDHVEEGALVDDAGEGTQLVAGAGEFTGETDGAEGRLGVRGLHERVPGRLQFLGGAAQDRRTCRAGRPRVPRR